MAKSGGRREAAARLFVAVSLATGLASPLALAAQRLELRAGVVASSALVSDEIAAGASTVQAMARPAPLVGIAVLLPLRPRFEVDVSGAYAASRLRAKDAIGAWDVQRLGIAQLLVGVRYQLHAAADSAEAVPAGGAYARLGAGGVRYLSGARSIFAGGNPMEPAVELAVGWQRSAGRWGVGAELGGQLHAFAPQGVLDAHGSRGGVRRAFLTAVLSRRWAR